MAKNAPVKKSKRRLKRNVRRSLAAVLMITAIGVAAIPVPENYAADPEISLYADGGSGDPHAEAVAEKFIYEPDVPTTDASYDKTKQKYDEKHGYANLVLDTYAKVSDTDLVAKLPKTDAEGKANPNYDPNLHVSFSVLNLGNDASGEEIYNLSWQFAYYLSKNPRGGGDAGVICKYNSEYYSPTVSLPLLPYTEYFVATQSDMDQYFSAGSGGQIANPSSDRLKKSNASTTGMDGTDPNTPVKYSYKNYKANLTPDSFLTEYFEEELNEWKKGCDAYDVRKEEAQRNNTTFTEDEPADFSKTPASNDLTQAQKRQYFAEHCNVLKSAGSGWQLYGVQDGRPNSKGGTIYLAKGGSLEGSSPFYVGDFGFLAVARSDYSMCAIGVRAFAKVNNVVNMEVPDQIGYIGDEAFMEASLLQSVKLNNVTFIGNRAFKGCTNLTSADLGSATETIGQECFARAEKLQDIKFGTAVSTIGYGAFYNCSSMTSIAFTEKGQPCTVKDYAFYNCAALTGVSMENANIIQLGDGVFATSTGAQPMSFVLPKTLGAESNGIAQNDVIGDFLFAGRASLQYVIFPQEYGRSREAKIPDNIFHGCIALQYVEFPCNPQNDPTACGFVKYTPGKLLADVQNPDLYVKGPKTNSSGADAYPRTSTWDARSAVSSTVPYLYIENGVEYYEVSDGYYLICINDQGIMTSCTFKSQNPSDWQDWLKEPNWDWGKDVAGDAEAGEDGAEYKNWGGEGGKLVIPAMVGETRVVGIASDCFKDTQLNRRVRELVIEDNSISSIADGVFQGGGGSANNDWQALEKVYIGNSVDSIGNNAFKDCISLIDVTFSSPSGGYEAFTIGTDAFKTQSPQLTFHGDIVEGYEPFEWATDPGNVINADKGLRVCYKSLAPTYLTVMYNPVTDMVTLLDYPKYDEISSILNEAHADEIGAYGTYENMRVQQLYAQFAVSDYDGRRTDFADKWQAYLDNGEDPTQLYSDSVYYGPWVNPDFCKGDGEKGWKKYLSGDSAPKEEEPDVLGKVTDFFLEPIVAYAAEDKDPDPYYKTYVFDVALIVGANDPYRTPSEEERALVLSTRDIVIPAGVDSIDVYGYRYNLTEDGTPTNNGENSENYSTYLLRSWDSRSANMYLGSSDPDEDGIRAVPGLFSGYYEDGAAAPSETRKRGNDLITSVTMSTVKYLPDNAFDSCEGLNWVIIGSELDDIGKAPFRGCYALTNVNCSGNEKYSFDNGIIYSNNSDSSLMIEECLAARGNLVGPIQLSADTDPSLLSVSTIREGAFEDCDYINEVNFGQNNTAGLTVIPEDCFKNCDSLQRVTLPKTVNDVKQGAFVNITGLTDLYVYGKEVQISAKAFDGERDSEGNLDKRWTSVHAYEDSAVVRYVGQYGTEYKLQLYSDWLGEVWQVSFYDQNYELIEDLKDLDGEPLRNPQDVPNGERPTTPQNPPNTDDWTFERWVGMNNVKLGDRIYDNTAFYAQGYSTSGLVNGKYPVSFWDGVDGTQVGPMQYIDPGSSAIPPAHPSHEGYEPDGYSEDYTNVQSPMTIIMLYKPTGSGSGGSGTGTGTGSGGSTQTPGTGSSSNTSSNTSSGASTTSASSDSTSTLSGMYTVTVINGSGSGHYAPGATVLIQANTPAAGSVFSKWTTESQGVSLASVSTTPTTFTMPANNVTITAEFTAGTAPATGSGSNNNNGNTGNGSTRVDITKPGISNKDLATANVNGSTDNFVVKITETDEATRAVQAALTNKYGSLENILYYAMDISLYDSTGTVKITNTAGLSVDITIPIPDALVAYGGNNMAGAVINGDQLENLSESFTTINGVPCIRFTATHFSPYTIYVDTGNLTEGMLDITPKTGDPIHPKWFLSIGLACLSIILFMKKDKAVKVKTA